MPSRRLLSFLLFSLLFSSLVHAQPKDDGRRAYVLPADRAEASLKRFAEQSGRALLVSTDTVQDIRTNPVNGELTALEAINQLLAGTGLAATEDPKNGGIRGPTRSRKKRTQPPRSSDGG